LRAGRSSGGPRGPQTHAELAIEVGLPFQSLQRIVEAFGFARPEPGHAVVAAERPVDGAGGCARFLRRRGRLGAVRFAALGPIQLPGLTSPIQLFEARRS
jgi:hypothetical protein